MKVNFSIDFILGSCGNNSCDKKKYLENKNYTVEWKSKQHDGAFLPSNDIKKEYVENKLMSGKKQEKYFSHLNYLHRKSDEHTPGLVFEPTFDPRRLQTSQYPNYYLSKYKAQNWPKSSAEPFPISSQILPQDSNYDPRRNDPSAIDMSTSFSSDDSEEDSKSSRRTSPGYDDAKNTSGDHGKSRGTRIGRRLFTGVQILELENVFSTKQYLTRTERAYLSQKVNLTECQIKTWFQNRRTKEKRRGHSSEEEDVMNDDVMGQNTRNFLKPVRIPGYGIQVRPTFGPPDKHLKAAIVDFLRRKSPVENCVSHS